MDDKATHFLNVDLELKSRADLGPLLAALDKTTVVLHTRKERGMHYASLELYEFSKYTKPETCIARFVQLVRRLPPTARRLWDRALQRRFDIGIEAVPNGGTYASHVTVATLRGAAEVCAEIAVTVYAPLRPRRRAPSDRRARSR